MARAADFKYAAILPDEGTPLHRPPCIVVEIPSTSTTLVARRGAPQEVPTDATVRSKHSTRIGVPLLTVYFQGTTQKGGGLRVHPHAEAVNPRHGPVERPLGQLAGEHAVQHKPK